MCIRDSRCNNINDVSMASNFLKVYSAHYNQHNGIQNFKNLKIHKCVLYSNVKDNAQMCWYPWTTSATSYQTNPQNQPKYLCQEWIKEAGEIPCWKEFLPTGKITQFRQRHQRRRYWNVSQQTNTHISQMKWNKHSNTLTGLWESTQNVYISNILCI